jgi:hypothetical protein
MSFSGSRPVPEPHGKVGTVWVEFQIIICSLTVQRLVTLAGLQGLTQRNWASPLTEWFHRKFAAVAWQGPKAPNFPQAASQTADHHYISLRAGQRLRMETALARRSDGLTVIAASGEMAPVRRGAADGNLQQSPL